MKAHALILGAAVSLIGFGAFAQSDDKPIPERAPIDDRPTAVMPPGPDEKRADVDSVRAKTKDAVAEAKEADRQDTEKRRPPSWIGI